MKVKEFLTSVLPDVGFLIAATPFTPPGTTDRLWQNVVVEDVPALVHQCGTWLLQSKDVFYAMASFAKREVWNPNKINKRTGEKGAYEKRTQANVKYLKSFYLDLDVKPEPGCYATQSDGLTALKSFCKTVGLPKPMIVNSGHGLHAYWTLDANITRDDWQPTAEKLKLVCSTVGLLTDDKVTTDSARVLRPPGSRNFKQGGTGMPVEVLLAAGPYSAALIDAALTQYLAGANVAVPARKPANSLAGAQTPFPGVEGNLSTQTGPPLNPDELAWQCLNFARQAADRGATGKEPEWYTALGLAAFCGDPDDVGRSVSDGHPGFDPALMKQKMSQWSGPPSCKNFHDASKANEAICNACRHWTKIKSPASTGRIVQEAPPPEDHILINDVKVPMPPLPKPYQRIVRADNSAYIGIVSEDEDGKKLTQVICPYELYPKRVMRQTTGDEDVEESTMWVAKLPRIGDMEFRLPQSLLSDTRKLHGTLLSRGAHMNATEARTTNEFMHAYLKELARIADRERLYERLGWHEDHKVFVTPRHVYTRTGEVLPHVPNGTIRMLTREMKSAGTKDAWFNGVKDFIGGAGSEHLRFLGAFAFGAPLLHMTGHKGIMIAASGDTGRGKTTALEICASIFGEPEALILAGGQQGSTLNGLFMALGTMHSYPMFWDDTTEREPEEMRKFMLHISSGRDKIRMSGHEHDGHMRTWETLVISSANTDDVHRILATGKDSNPHLMRLISVEFGEVDVSSDAKTRADRFKRVLRENYGHVGNLYLQYIVQNYDRIRNRIITVMEKFDFEQDVEPSERFWSAGVACALVGTHIAYKLGLWPFDPFADMRWAERHLTKMRSQQASSASTSVDILDEFLNDNISRSIILQAKGTSNIDNIASRAYNELWIRREMDNGLIYISRSAFNKYCSEVKANFGKIESELMTWGILQRKECYKVLGADTPYASGQTRCWEISIPKLVAHKRKK